MISGRLNPSASTAGSARRWKINLATPAYGSQYDSCYVRTIYSLLSRGSADGVAFSLSEIDYSDIVAARNYLVSNFYFNRKDCSHMLFLDSDMGFPYELFKAMLALEEEVVGVIYPRRSLDLEVLHRHGDLPFHEAYHLALSMIGSLLPVSHPRDSRFSEASNCGTGILLIARSCIDRFLQVDPTLLNRERHQSVPLFKQKLPKGVLTIFDKVQYNGEELSEDFSFCWRWRELCQRSIWATRSPGIEHAGSLLVTSRA
jgi:hypothetical protein